jgi:hypothetical protein
MFTLLGALPEFLRGRITVGQAEEQIGRMLELREKTFIDLARARIYENPASPYLRLLKIAGCAFSDLKAEVDRRGLEPTLERLAGEGVYLTSDEFKGKKEVARGGASFRVSPGDFAPAESAPGFTSQSSGTRNQPISSVLSLDLLAVWALAKCICFTAHDLFSRSHAVYDAILPTSGGVRDLLTNVRLGIETDRWFARKIPASSRLAAAYHYLNTYQIVVMGKLYARRFPAPEFIGIEEVGRIVHWVSEKRREGKNCCIRTVASNATRIARAAWETGVSLEGTKFFTGGEPVTQSKRELIERAGAGVVPSYGAAPGMSIGYGCANAVYADDLHVHRHLLAVLPHPRPVNRDGPPVHPLLFTTLHPTAPRFFLNVENGDYGSLEQRKCGCALERVGFKLHLHHIRSYEKLTSEGMNYFYGDLYEFLEKTLPSEFGGGTGDYQLVEEEDGDGQTRITLLVHPAVGELDEEQALRRLRTRLADGSSAQRFQAEIWRNAGTLRVRRQPPYASPAGKILPLHISR